MPGFSPPYIAVYPAVKIDKPIQGLPVCQIGQKRRDVMSKPFFGVLEKKVKFVVTIWGLASAPLESFKTVLCVLNASLGLCSKPFRD